MSRRAFITGIRGFVGPYLADALQHKGLEVWGLAHTNDDLRHVPELRDVHIAMGDVRDPDLMRKVLSACEPDQIVHLAGISEVRCSFRNPRLTYSVNFDGTLNLFETVRELGLNPRVVNVSSAAVYGKGDPGSSGFSETSPVHPNSPYAASKLMTEALAEHYATTFNMRVTTARAFNHIGPRQSEAFVCSDFARQIAEMKLGWRKPVLSTGTLTAERDFTDVRDVVRAYMLLAELGTPGETYNVCSGKARSIADIVHLLVQASGIDVVVETDPARVRPIEVPRVVGNFAKIRSEVGWEPHLALRDTLAAMLDYWTTHLTSSQP